MNAQVKISLNLTQEEVNKVLAGLNQLPHGQVAELFQSIRIQCIAQLAPAAPETPAEATPAE